MKQIDFYFDFISPYSYLAARQFGMFPDRYSADIEWIPVNLPKLIKLSGNVPPATVRNKAIYSLRDLKRWASYLDVPFKMIMPGSFDSRPALRIAAALAGEERVAFCQAVFDGLWSGAINTKEEGWLDALFELKQLPDAWRGLCNDVLDENTATALKAGAFGVPTFVLQNGRRSEMFFGVDHMEFLARACQQA